MKLIPRRKKQGTTLGRQLALGRLGDALARAEQQAPARIHNPHGGTRSHYLDPLSLTGPSDGVKPVCNASGAVWADGDGGLQLCGLCPRIWVQRQGGNGEKSGAVA